MDSKDRWRAPSVPGNSGRRADWRWNKEKEMVRKLQSRVTGKKGLECHVEEFLFSPLSDHGPPL